jgi:hypothetical protein
MTKLVMLGLGLSALLSAAVLIVVLFWSAKKR